MQVGRRPVGSHKADPPGSSPGPATLRKDESRERSDESQSLAIGLLALVSSLSALFSSGPSTQTGKAARSRAWCLWVRLPLRSVKGGRLEAGDRRKIGQSRFLQPSYFLLPTSSFDPVVQRHDTSPTYWRRWFDSIRDQSQAGSWSNGKTSARQVVDPGSTPGESTDPTRKAAGYGWPDRTANAVPLLRG